MTDRPLLAVDTATRQATLAVGVGPAPAAVRAWQAGHRHSETLLAELEVLLAEAHVSARDLRAVVVGLGPGSFTGLRVGLAMAKTLAYGLAVPIVGVGTAEALALAAVGDADGPPDVVVLQPAGPTDRYRSQCRVVAGRVEMVDGPRLLTPADAGAAAVAADVRVVAVDLEPAAEAGDETIAAGLAALEGLGAALLRLGTAALDAGRTDDVAELVPAYVTLPRGIAPAAEGRDWSPDLR